jgi:putative DNA primase/helicase
VERRWFVFPQVWKTEICAGLDPTTTARVLAAKRMLILDSSGSKFPRPERTPHGPKRVYVLTSQILDGGLDDA